MTRETLRKHFASQTLAQLKQSRSGLRRMANRGEMTAAVALSVVESLIAEKTAHDPNAYDPRTSDAPCMDEYGVI